MPVIDTVELGISLVLEIWLIALLLRRDEPRHFPYFFGYMLVAVPGTAARLLAAGHYHLYFYVFWWSSTLFILLGLAALHEVFRSVYEGFYLSWWFRLAYYGTIALVLIVTIRNAILHPPVQAHPVISLILDAGIAVNLMQAGMVALYAFLGQTLNVGFPRYPSGIAAGFAASSIGPFIGYVLRSDFGTRFETLASHSTAVAYLCALAVWLSTFIRPEQNEKDWKPPMSPEEMLTRARGYLGALGRSRNDHAR